MSGLSQVFMQELRLRKAVFPAALVTGLVPIPMALLMKDVASFSEAVEVGSAAFAFIGGILLALYLGATVLGQDLSEGRQGYYFSKPIGGFALWAGKFGAAWIAVLGAILVCLLPAAFMGSGLAHLGPVPNPFWVYDIGPENLSALWSPVIVSLGILGLMALAHAASVIFRARTRWLALDAAMVILLPTIVWWATKRAFSTGSLFVLALESAILCAGFFAAILASGAAQTIKGRADLLRGHRVISLTLWSVLAVTVTAVASYSQWASAVSPSDIGRFTRVDPAPSGPWMIVSGPLKHRGPDATASFLLNGETGTWRKLQAGWWEATVTFSPDGRLAVTTDSKRFPREPRLVGLVSYDLSGGSAEGPSDHGILVPPYSEQITFSPDGTRLALLTGQNLSIYDLPSWKLAAAARIDRPRDAWSTCRFYFTDRDTLRLYLFSSVDRSGQKRDRVGTEILEFSVPLRKFATTGFADGILAWSVTVNAAGDKMMARKESSSDSDLILFDARTGEILKQLPGNSAKKPGRFLWDGRIVVHECEKDGSPPGDPRRILRVYSQDGNGPKTIPIEGGRNMAWGPEIQPGKILVYRWDSHTRIDETGEVYALDADAGTLKPVPGLRPQTPFRWWWAGPRLQTQPGSEGTHFFPDSSGKLVRYDFKTGKAEAVRVIQ